MKLKFFIACIMAHIASLNAQTSAPTTVTTNPGTLSGKVVDKKTNEPIPYASVTVKDGSAILSGAITKENGTFTVTNLTLKELTVEVQFMGYKKYVKNFSLSNSDKSANLNIALEEEATQLDEVSVVKERSTIEQKIDRKVVNVGRDVIGAGTTASEM